LFPEAASIGIGPPRVNPNAGSRELWISQMGQLACATRSNLQNKSRIVAESVIRAVFVPSVFPFGEGPEGAPYIHVTPAPIGAIDGAAMISQHRLPPIRR
jgi:hypothetical protein